MRNAYVSECQAAQRAIIANTGNKTLCRIYEKTWGNYQTIADFVQYAQEQGQEAKAVSLLSNITDKDLRDISLEALKDCLDYTPGLEQSALSMPIELYAQYILSPRISNEMIVPFRQAFSTYFPAEEVLQYHNDPRLLAEWTKQNISINNEANPQRIPISPSGVLKAMVADKHSRDIFFVAMARSMGIAAQINPVNGNVQYYDGNQWINVDFEAAEPVGNAIGYLDLRYIPNTTVADPKYYTHFSIKRFNGHSFQLLAYDAKDPGIDDGLTLSSFDHPTPLEEGYYILTSGTRLEDGTALTHSEFFTIRAGETTKVNLILREHKQALQVIGHFDAGELVKDVEGYYILALLDQSEPSTHALQEIEPLLERDVPMFLIDNRHEEFETMKARLVESLGLEKETLPIVIVANDQGEVFFLQQGYRIGLGEQLIQLLFAQ